MSRAWVVGSIAVAACAPVPLTAQPPTLAEHAAELATSGAGRADVEVDQGGTRRVFRDDVVAVVLRGNQKSHLWGLVKTGTPDQATSLTVGELVAGCDDTGTNRGCALARIDGPIQVGTRQRFDAARAGVFLFGLAATTVASLCLAACSERSGWAYVGAGLGAVTMLAPLATARF